MATEVSAAPAPSVGSFQSVQKAMALPTVGAAVEQFGALYTKVKGAHSLLEWALSTAEASVALAATTAAPYVAAPLAGADAKVAAAIDNLERRVPIITENPKVIVETTKQAVLTRVSPHVNKVCGVRAAAGERVQSLKELSWSKANVLLSTVYGQKALSGMDTGAGYVMQLLDHYLPAIEPVDELSNDIVPAANDPALHTVQTVGRLSSVAARRVWSNLAYKIEDLRKSGIELDVRRYIAALLAAVHLAAVNLQQQRNQQQQQQQQQEQQQQQHEEVPPTSTEPKKAPVNSSEDTESSSKTVRTKSQKQKNL